MYIYIYNKIKNRIIKKKYNKKKKKVTFIFTLIKKKKIKKIKIKKIFMLLKS